MAQAILQHVELQPTDGGDQDLLIMEAAHDQDRPFLRHLGDALDEGFSFSDIRRSQTREDLGLELRQGLKIEPACYGDGIADREDAGIDDADDIPRVRFLDRTPFLCDQAMRSSQTNVFAQPMVFHDHIALKAT